MTQSDLPTMAQESVTRSLPSDPTMLLTASERQELAVDLAGLARSRRDAETSSASLKLA